MYTRIWSDNIKQHITDLNVDRRIILKVPGIEMTKSYFNRRILRGLVENSGHCVAGLVFTDVPKKRNVLRRNGWTSTLASQDITSGNTNPPTQLHFPEDL